MLLISEARFVPTEMEVSKVVPLFETGDEPVVGSYQQILIVPDTSKVLTNLHIQQTKDTRSVLF